MESASKLSALAQLFGLGDAIKSWFELFNLFLEANQIVIAENLHASTFSGIATSRELLKRQLQLITSSRSIILASGTEIDSLPLAVGLAGARRVDPLQVIISPVSLTKQERRCAYDCESDFNDNSFLTSSTKEVGNMDFNDSIDSVVATDSNSDYDDASDVDPISSFEKCGIPTSVLTITASTSVLTLRKFPARIPFKCSIQNSRHLVLKEIPIPA